ncbi:MAG: hypothetical protein ACTHN5_00065 [Phycisphaerae bacterium]
MSDTMMGTSRSSALSGGSIDQGAPVNESVAIPLVKRVTCPHCWFEFRPEQILWVAQHEELMGDPILREEPLRFLPTRFTVEGQAIDARGMICHSLACPACHLILPRVLIENEVTVISIIGSAGSGKSNFLATMTWEMRQRLAKDFAIIFADGDKEANWIVNRYEETLFLPENPELPVVLDKTRTQGDLYRSVNIHGQETQLPKPFLFSLHPGADHPRAALRAKLGRIVCLYDNAGEHYNVGADTSLTPVTRHLSRSKVLMFLLDPTQDPRFRAKCKGVSHDPQVQEPLHTVRQENILSEAAIRFRKHTGLSAYQKCDRPLLVLVGKSDIWAPLIPDEDLVTEPILKDSAATSGEHLAALDMDRIERISVKLRRLLLDATPEVVSNAEDFSDEVLYMPVSALGHSPEKYPDKNGLLIKPKDVAPHWVTIPLLYSYARWSTGLIAGVRGGK